MNYTHTYILFACTQFTETSNGALWASEGKLEIGQEINSNKSIKPELPRAGRSIKLITIQLCP